VYRPLVKRRGRREKNAFRKRGTSNTTQKFSKIVAKRVPVWGKGKRCPICFYLSWGKAQGKGGSFGRWGGFWVLGRIVSGGGLFGARFFSYGWG